MTVRVCDDEAIATRRPVTANLVAQLLTVSVEEPDHGRLVYTERVNDG